MRIGPKPCSSAERWSDSAFSCILNSKIVQFDKAGRVWEIAFGVSQFSEVLVNSVNSVGGIFNFLNFCWIYFIELRICGNRIVFCLYL